jgi:single-strand DNA-binding protein
MINNATISGLIISANLRLITKADGDLSVCEALMAFSFYGRNAMEEAPVQLVAYGAAADLLSKQEGKNVIIEGRFDQQPAPEGSKTKPLVIVVRTVHLLGDTKCQLNIVSLVGRLGQDPEIKYFESGAVVASGGLAMDKKKSEDPVWVNYKAWDKMVEVMASFTRKGTQIAITGRLTMESWEGGSKLVVKVESMQLPPKGSSNVQSSEPSSSGAAYDEIF